MILVLLLMASGVLWNFGAQGQRLAKRLITMVLVIILGSAVLEYFVASLGVSLASGPSSSLGWWVLGLALVTLVGYASFRGREHSKRKLEAWRKKNLHPRQRALPPPPEETL